MAAALALHLELEVVETGTFAVHTDLDLPTDRTNLVVRAFEHLHSADGFEFRIASKIPLSGGLGSSAAATIAGLMAADHLFELDADIAGAAVGLEGHPDNIAAALHGGFTICDGPRAHRLEAPLGLEGVLVVPHVAVRTRQARSALPARVPLADAVFNVAHASMLVLGLATANWELIAAGLGDRLHQPARAHLFPRSAQLLERAGEFGALGATISGAGPDSHVLVPVTSRPPASASVSPGTPRGWASVMRVTFESRGADVRSCIPEL